GLLQPAEQDLFLVSLARRQARELEQSETDVVAGEVTRQSRSPRTYARAHHEAEVPVRRLAPAQAERVEQVEHREVPGARAVGPLGEECDAAGAARQDVQDERRLAVGEAPQDERVLSERTTPHESTAWGVGRRISTLITRRSLASPTTNIAPPRSKPSPLRG